MFFGLGLLPKIVFDASSSGFLYLLQTPLVGVRVTNVAAFFDPVEERLWRSPDSVSVCVARSFLMLTIATAVVRRGYPCVDCCRIQGWQNSRRQSFNAFEASTNPCSKRLDGTVEAGSDYRVHCRRCIAS